MPDTLRSCIIAEDSFSFISLDASQIELRVLAVLSQDPQLLEDIKSEDLHQATADRMGVDRYDAKQVNFAMVYGADEYKIAYMLECTEAEALELMGEHKKAYPRLYEWMAEQVVLAKENGYVVNMFGRIRPIPELYAGSYKVREKAEREVVNTIVQGSAVDIVKLAMLYLRKFLDRSIKLVLQVHDEILWECPDGLLDQALEICKTLKQQFPDYPFKIAVGKIYNQLEEIE